MKLVKEFLNQKLNEDLISSDENSVATNQLKNIMKNAQSMLDMLQGGQELDPETQSKLAVSDDKMQDIKNTIENQETEKIPGEGAEVLDTIPIGGDLPAEPMDIEGSPEDSDGDLAGLLPEPFPKDEIEGDAEFGVDIDGDGIGDVNVLDVETRYEDDIKED